MFFRVVVMNSSVCIGHVAVEGLDEQKSDLFFMDILGLKRVKSFTLSDSLSEEIFGIRKECSIVVYGNNMMQVEVFLTGRIKETSFDHLCLLVDNKQEFIRRCQQYGLHPVLVKKEKKQLLFVQDWSHNWYEIKEKALG